MLDLRAGLELSNGHRRGWVWGKDVTDGYCWTNVFTNGDAIARFIGQPATYRVSFSARL